MASVALAALVAVVWWQVLDQVHKRVVKQLVVMVARTDRVTGELHPHPDGRVLLSLGQELGFYGDLATDVPGSGNPGAYNNYAQRYFGVAHTVTRLDER